MRSATTGQCPNDGMCGPDPGPDSNGTTYDYTWQGNGWQLSSGGGLRNELRTTTICPTNANIYTSTYTVWQGSGAPVLTRMETRQVFSFGDRLVSEVVGSGAAARTNIYTYTSAGKVQQIVRWDGSWEYYVYDGFNRATNRFSAFLNQGVTTDRSLCRLTVYDYSSNSVAGSGDTGINYFHTPRCTIDYVKGVEVGRKYFVGLDAQRRDIQCVEPGVAWNNSQAGVRSHY